jgi:hypothetical protein
MKKVTEKTVKEEKIEKQEPNSLLISNELVNGLFDYFVNKPHKMSDIENLVNGLRSGIPIVYNQEEQKEEGKV